MTVLDDKYLAAHGRGPDERDPGAGPARARAGPPRHRPRVRHRLVRLRLPGLPARHLRRRARPRPCPTSTPSAWCSGPGSTRSSPPPPSRAPSCSTPSPAAATRASSAGGTARTPASTGPPTRSGTAPWPAPPGSGGAVAIIGDDPSCKSSTVPSSCEPMAQSLAMPLLAPGSVAEVIELGLHAVALSRATGLWTGLKIVADVADASCTVDLGALRPELVGIPAPPATDRAQSGPLVGPPPSRPSTTSSPAGSTWPASTPARPGSTASPSPPATRTSPCSPRAPPTPPCCGRARTWAWARPSSTRSACA